MVSATQSVHHMNRLSRELQLHCAVCHSPVAKVPVPLLHHQLSQDYQAFSFQVCPGFHDVLHGMWLSRQAPAAHTGNAAAQNNTCCRSFASAGTVLNVSTP